MVLGWKIVALRDCCMIQHVVLRHVPYIAFNIMETSDSVADMNWHNDTVEA